MGKHVRASHVREHMKHHFVHRQLCLCQRLPFQVTRCCAGHEMCTSRFTGSAAPATKSARPGLQSSHMPRNLRTSRFTEWRERVSKLSQKSTLEECQFLFHIGWRPPNIRLEAITSRLEAIAIRYSAGTYVQMVHIHMQPC